VNGAACLHREKGSCALQEQLTVLTQQRGFLEVVLQRGQLFSAPLVATLCRRPAGSVERPEVLNQELADVIQRGCRFGVVLRRKQNALVLQVADDL